MMEFRFITSYYVGRCGGDEVRDGGSNISGGQKHTCRWEEGTDGFVSYAYRASTREAEVSFSAPAKYIEALLETNAKGGFREEGRDENQTARVSSTLRGTLTVPPCPDIYHCSGVAIVYRKETGNADSVTLLVNGIEIYEGGRALIDRTTQPLEIEISLHRSGEHIGAAGELYTLLQVAQVFLFGVYDRRLPSILAAELPGVLAEGEGQRKDICAHYSMMDDSDLYDHAAASVYLRGISEFTLQDVLNESKCYLELLTGKMKTMDDQMYYDLVYLELYHIGERIEAPDTPPVIRSFLTEVQKYLTRRLIDIRLPIVRDRLQTRNRELETLKLVDFNEIAANMEGQRSIFANSREATLAALIKVRQRTSDAAIASSIEQYVSRAQTFDEFFNEFLALLRGKQEDADRRIDQIREEADFYYFELNQLGKVVDLERI
jgi:hypothetical protein